MTMSSNAAFEVIDRAMALRLLPKRDATAHKWSVGGLLIVGGAPGYIGAPALAAMAASRSGAGIVNLAIPRSSVGATATLAPEAVFLPLPETDSIHGVQTAIELIAPVAEKTRALVVGPGLSRDEPAAALLRALFGDGRQSSTRSMGFGGISHESASDTRSAIIGKSQPAVIDADALHWLSHQADWSKHVDPFSLVLTPHVGELSALTGASSDDIIVNPGQAARSAAARWQQTVVLKAGISWISNGDSVYSLGETCTALATAGTGDVLAGSIGAFLAQKLGPIEAASLALYVGTEAAKRLSSELSTLGVIAGDLPRAIATVLADLESEIGVS